MRSRSDLIVFFYISKYYGIVIILIPKYLCHVLVLQASPQSSVSKRKCLTKITKFEGDKKKWKKSGTSTGETGDSYLNLNNII